MIVNTEIENVARRLNVGQHKVKCPLCQDQRSKHKGDKPLSLNIESDKVVFNCHHCGENGVVFNDNKAVSV